VNREVIGTQPVAVQYSLTERGARFRALLDAFGDLEADPTLRDLEL